MKGDQRRTGTATTPDKGKGHEQQGGEAEAVKQNAARCVTQTLGASGSPRHSGGQRACRTSPSQNPESAFWYTTHFQTVGLAKGGWPDFDFGFQRERGKT